jgi:hypothetical protein
MLPFGCLAIATIITNQAQEYLTNSPLLSSFLSVANETNQSLMASQEKLLLWHWKLGHAGFQ